MLTITAAVAAAALSATPRGPHHPWFVGGQFARDALLVTPAPYPPNRTDDPRRPENGRLWVSRVPVGTRTPIHEAPLGAPGPASYGAPSRAAGEIVHARIGHTPIAFDPWTRVRGHGALARVELARNQWLREQGYVLKVRTHVNALPVTTAAAASTGPALPAPRATIRLDDEQPRRPAKQRVMGPPRVVERSTLALR